jgi:hypothetical protein
VVIKFFITWTSITPCIILNSKYGFALKVVSNVIVILNHLKDPPHTGFRKKINCIDRKCSFFSR